MPSPKIKLSTETLQEAGSAIALIREAARGMPKGAQQIMNAYTSSAQIGFWDENTVASLKEMSVNQYLASFHSEVEMEMSCKASRYNNRRVKYRDTLDELEESGEVTPEDRERLEKLIADYTHKYEEATKVAKNASALKVVANSTYLRVQEKLQLTTTARFGQASDTRAFKSHSVGIYDIAKSQTESTSNQQQPTDSDDPYGLIA